MIEVFVPAYIILAMLVLVPSIVGLMDPIHDGHRQLSAALVLTFWAWPLWALGLILWGVWHLTMIALGKE